jgi:hypothetical protein
VIAWSFYKGEHHVLLRNTCYMSRKSHPYIIHPMRGEKCTLAIFYAFLSLLCFKFKRSPSLSTLFSDSLCMLASREVRDQSYTIILSKIIILLSSVFRGYSTTRIEKKFHGLSPRVNYTDRATAACRRSDCQLLRIEGATWSAWRIPTAVFSIF